MPSSAEGREAEVASLNEKILDRAGRLDELLDAGSVVAAEQWLMTPTEESAADRQVLSELRFHARNIRTETELLLERDSSVEAAEPLDPDPELRLEVHKVSRAAFKISRRIDEVVQQEQRSLKLMENKAQSLVTLSSLVTDGEGAADTTADDNSELVASLEKLDGEIRTARLVTHTFDSDVLPSESKWWRYRWEYSYVEAEILVIICLLAIVWEWLLWYLKNVLWEKMWRSPSFNRDYHMSVIHSQCAFLAALETCTLLLVFITLALMRRFDIWQYLVDVQYWVAPAIHQPRSAEDYNSIALGVTVQLSLAMFFFFWHCFSLVSHSQQTLIECTQLEQLSEVIATSSPMVKMKLTSAQDYADTKKAFFKSVRQTHDMANILSHFVDPEEANQCNENDFLMWYFIAQNIKGGIEQTAKMKPLTWGVLLLTFLVFAVMHGAMCVAGTWAYVGIGFVLLIADFWMVRSMKSDVDKAVEERDAILHREAETPTWSIAHTHDVGGIGDEAHFEGKAVSLSQFRSVTDAIERLNEDGSICREGLCIVRSENQDRYHLLWRSDRQHEVFEKFGLESSSGFTSPKQMLTFSFVYQLILLFMCFGAARLIFCFWMWKYFFWSTLLTAILLVVAICIFQLFTAPWTIAHFVVASFPPHVAALQDRKNLKLTQRHSLVEKALGFDGLQLDNYSSVS